MEAALAAERAAEDAVREAQRDSARAIQEATERAGQIARRCDERVTRIHDHCAAALADRIATLRLDEDAVHATRAPDADIATLLDRVAAWLTSPS
jgi:hypothetical protein